MRSPALEQARAVRRYIAMLDRGVKSPAAWHAIAARLAAVAHSNELAGASERAQACRANADAARERARRLGLARMERRAH